MTDFYAHTRLLSENLSGLNLSRRQLLKRSMAVGLAVPVVGTILAACDDEDADDGDAPAATDDDTDDEADTDDELVDDDADEDDDDAPADTEGRRGGEIRFVTPGEVGSLDTHTITQAIVGQVSWNMFEHLFTWDEDLLPTPELADGFELSDDGLTATIPLREGVLFHNGDEMTAEDVVASLERWVQVSANTGLMSDILEEFEEVDEYTVAIHISSAYGAMLPILCRQNLGPAIFPLEVMERVGMERLESEENYIGTGPYQFVEWAPDRHIHLTRFEDYVSRQEDPSGYAGFKNQYLDDIYFVPVGDRASAVAGLQTGDYDYVQSVSSVHFETLDSHDNVHAEVLDYGSWGQFAINLAWGPLSGFGEDHPGQLLRRALMVGLDLEELSIVGSGEGFYELHPSLAHLGLPWRTDADGDLWEMGYNANDPDLAREYMERAGYDGEEIIWMVARDQEYHYDVTFAAVDQWQDIGLNVDLQVYDWATIGERRLEKEGVWHGYSSRISFRPDPSNLAIFSSSDSLGWWDNEEKNQLSQQLQELPEFEDRLEVWNDMQRLWYRQAPQIKISDGNDIDAWTQRLKGWPFSTQLQTHLANVWVEDD